MQAYLVGSPTGRGKEINLANRKTPRMQKEKGEKKYSEILCRRSPVHKFTP